MSVCVCAHEAAGALCFDVALQYKLYVYFKVRQRN
jgi:hypothetical protein